MSTVTAARFDYSYEQWTAIENEVAKVRPGSLTDFERRRLLNAANLYLIGSREPNFIKWHFAETSKRWKRVEKLSAELADAIASGTALLAHTTREIERVPPALTKLREFAAVMSVDRVFRTRTPKQSFYVDVLKVWTDRGGKLGWSTNAQVGGPCVRYFKAVVRPVMGDDSPKLSYIKDIIDDEKRRRQDPLPRRKSQRISRA
ncbi:hypothetical protein SAMN05443247_06445 [Bradyrhizobium erythrophlei]|nr:hypothetical protein SAMN05443247_06445 [Bradyrhizobium erythrophlei]